MEMCRRVEVRVSKRWGYSLLVQACFMLWVEVITYFAQVSHIKGVGGGSISNKLLHQVITRKIGNNVAQRWGGREGTGRRVLEEISMPWLFTCFIPSWLVHHAINSLSQGAVGYSGVCKGEQCICWDLLFSHTNLYYFMHYQKDRS